MTEKQEHDPFELTLAREIRNLDREMVPARDLWPGIERRLAQYPQKGLRRKVVDWMPYGVAASLVIAVSALMLTLLREPQAVPQVVSFERSIDGLQAEYVRVRNPLVQSFSETNSSLDPVVIEELYRNLEIMEQARRDIEDQVRKNPSDRRLVEKLMWIHEQELALLKRDYTQPTRSM